MSKLDYSKLSDLQVDGIDRRDVPDFCDAYIAYGSYDGRELTDEELDMLNEDSGFVYDLVMERIY